MDVKLNHSDLSALLAKETGMSLVKAELFTKTVFDVIIEGLEQDGIVKINGLGTFRLTDVASRSSVNVNTGEKFEIKGHKKLVFAPADTLKDCVNRPFAMFEPVEVDESYTDDEPDAVEDAEEKEVLQQNIKPEADNVEDEPCVAETVLPAEDVQTENVTAPDEKDAPEDISAAPVAVQERSAEPVLVRVPKKDKKAPVVEKKKNFKWVYIVGVMFLVLLVGAVLYNIWHTIAPSETLVVKSVTVVAEAQNNAEKTDAVTGATVDATTAATPQSSELNAGEPTVSDITEAQIKEKDEPYKFVIVDRLDSLQLKDITLADTDLYEFDGDWAQHRVAAGETLTRIALKYYGDKKLWPYIVKYNSLARPNDLSKGMTILIPRLKPIN